LLSSASGAQSQIDAPTPIEQVDPDAKKAPRPNPPETEESRPEEPEFPPEVEPPPPAHRPESPGPGSGPGQVRLPPREVGKPDAGRPSTAQTQPAPAAPPKALKPLKLAAATEADLQAAWEKWRKAETASDAKGADAAQAELLSLKESLGISDLDAYSVGLQRAAEEHRKAGEVGRAVVLAQAAVDLAPDLPFAHLRLARTRFAADASDWARYLKDLQLALVQLWTHPRYGRAELADLGAALLFALLSTATAVALVLFAKGARYFLHDFHHLFPRAAGRWQTSAIALLLLSIPALARLGLAPVLLVLFAASALYLSWVERLVAGALIAAIGFLPLGAGELVQRTAFEGTPAEAVFNLEQGGPGAQRLAAEIAKRVDADKAEAAEVYALARFELLRGKPDNAIAHLKKAAELRTNDPGVLTNLGCALLAKNDLEGAVDALTAATKAGPAFAPAWFDLSRALNRHAATLEAAPAALEQDQAQAARQQAERLDPSLATEKDPTEDPPPLNGLIISPPVGRDEILALAGGTDRGAKVQRQLSLQLLGDFDSPWAPAYPAAGAVVLVLLGALRGRVSASHSCERCGRPVCRRCDPELPPASAMCGQCVNVFARKSDVPAALRVRKQIEVERHRIRRGRVSYAFGLLLSGTGHLFAGLPIRGALYAFIFLFGVFNLFFRHGVLRAPYGTLPVALRLGPLAAVLLVVYLASLFGLYRRQSS
jgi:tetratricopeptide (TPR) repeat protein